MKKAPNILPPHTIEEEAEEPLVVPSDHELDGDEIERDIDDDGEAEAFQDYIEESFQAETIAGWILAVARDSRKENPSRQWTLHVADAQMVVQSAMMAAYEVQYEPYH